MTVDPMARHKWEMQKVHFEFEHCCRMPHLILSHFDCESVVVAVHFVIGFGKLEKNIANKEFDTACDSCTVKLLDDFGVCGDSEFRNEL